MPVRNRRVLLHGFVFEQGDRHRFATADRCPAFSQCSRGSLVVRESPDICYKFVSFLQNRPVDFGSGWASFRVSETAEPRSETAVARHFEIHFEKSRNLTEMAEFSLAQTQAGWSVSVFRASFR